MKGFLYAKTEYSILNSALRLEEYIKTAKESSFDFLSINDPNLYASYKFYNECINNNIKPIIGISYEFIIHNTKSELLIYAKNNNGYKNLMKLSSKIKIKDLNNIDDVLGYDDLYYVLVYDDSYLERLFFSIDTQLLNEFLELIKKNDIYIGLSNTNHLNKNYDEIRSFLRRNDIKILPIHKCLYLTSEDEIVYESIKKIDGKEEKIDEFTDYCFLTNPTFDIDLSDFISSINLNLYQDKISLPRYPNKENIKSSEYLYALCHKGLNKRGKYFPNYIERLNYELKVINNMGYDDYFLIVWDYIKYAKKNDILVGPGRGSAAGSLVAYCLGISDVDPIKFDLLFERFLNPERVSMPDIDTDFPDDKRDVVINYVKNFYGSLHVSNITTFGTFQIKSSANDLSKIFNIKDTTMLQDMILENGYDILLEKYREKKDIYNFLYVAKRIENFPKNIATHPAGIIISEKELTDIIPIQNGINGLYQAQLEKDDLESIGLLKMDFLGLKNLSMIHSMIKDLNMSFKELREIPLNDKKVYQMLSNRDTLGIFQLESNGITNVLGKLKPNSFNDLVATLALFRPGPKDNIEEYILRRHGKPFSYIHKDLEPILKETYGIIVYQEQIMKIAELFAGYSLGKADLLRRAISKKNAKKLEELEGDFITKSVKKGYSYEISKEIYDLIYKFADYGFNKSHTVAYAIISYQMAYLKVNYFNVFMSNILNNVIASTKVLLEYMNYAKNKGLIFKGPDINISTDSFISNNNILYMPINTIKSIGNVQTKAILNERLNGKFNSFDDFINRCDFINYNQLEGLIYSGAFDSFNMTKKQMIEMSKKNGMTFQKFYKDMIISEYSFDVLKEKEKEFLGFNLKYSIYNNILGLEKKYKTISLDKLEINKISNVICLISNYKERKTKNDSYMATLNISNEYRTIRAVIFPQDYINLKNKIVFDKLLNVKGKLTNNDNNLEFIIYDIINIS